MPYALRYPDRARLKLEICEALAAGVRLSEICRQAGMPTTVCVHDWARADADFAAALARARTRGRWVRLEKYDEAAGRAALGLMAQGVAFHHLPRHPGMPSLRVLRTWRATQAQFQEAVFNLQRDSYRARHAEGWRRRWRDYEPAVGDALMLRVGRGETLRAVLRSERRFPALSVLARWRRANPEFDAGLKAAMRAGRRARGRARIAAAEAAVAGAIGDGHSLRSLGGTSGLPARRTLYGWVARSPDFAEAVNLAMDLRDRRAADAARHRRPGRRPGRKWRGAEEGPPGPGSPVGRPG